jgi:hypothetical protein
VVAQVIQPTHGRFVNREKRFTEKLFQKAGVMGEKENMVINTIGTNATKILLEDEGIDVAARIFQPSYQAEKDA